MIQFSTKYRRVAVRPSFHHNIREHRSSYISHMHIYLSTDTTAQTFKPSCFPHLQILVLNTCGINSWKHVMILEQALPVVEQLSLAYCDLSDMEKVLVKYMWQ